MTFKPHILLSVIGLFLLTTCKKKEEVIRIAVANSVRPAAKALIDAYLAMEKGEAELVFASSGRLTAQIRDGAPFDLFMGAGRQYPQTLYQEGKTIGAPNVFASNVPVLQKRGKKAFPQGTDPIQILKNGRFRTIAIADPESSPFGRLTRKILSDAGLLEAIDGKAAFGTGISEVDRYIRTGNADLGITSRSTAMASKGEWIPFQGYRLEQAMVRIDRERSDREAHRVKVFWDFVRSAKAQRILKAHGHGIPERTASME